MLSRIEYVWRNLVVDLPARSAGRLWAFLAPFAGRSGAYWEDLMQKYPNDIRAAPRRRRGAAAPRRGRGHRHKHPQPTICVAFAHLLPPGLGWAVPKQPAKLPTCINPCLDCLDLHYAKPKRRTRKRGTVQLARTRDPPRANVSKR